MRKRIQLINKLARYHIRQKLVLRWILESIEFVAVIMSIPMAYFATRGLYQVYNMEWFADPFHMAIYSLLLMISWYSVSQVSLMAVFPRGQRFLNAAFLFSRGYLFVFVFLLLSRFILNLNSIPVVFIIINTGLGLIMTLTIRIISIHNVRVYRADGNNLRKIVIIGDGCSRPIIDKFLQQKDWGFDIRAIITQSDSLKRRYGSSIPVLPDPSNIGYILESQVVDEVFYCKNSVDEDELRQLIPICEEIGVVFRVQTSFSSVEPLRVELKTVNPSGNLSLVDIPSRKLAHDVKYIMDVLLSIIGVMLLFPVFCIICLLIRLDSKGPIFYKQERIGLRGRKFYLYKFRTMVVNAEELFDQLKEQNEMDGPTFKMKDDPRITRLGRILRKTGMDEFPQLYNVIKGEMSLIGPRPPVESEVKQYQRWQLRRLSVKPGITCIWQITPQRNDVKFDKWMKMDLNYIDNWSLTGDVGLLFKTIVVMVLATGR